MSASEIVGVALLTLRVGVVATALIALPAIATGWLLARRRFRGHALVQTLASLPMVLPPVAVGLFLLQLFSRRCVVGRALESLLGGPILLTWQAAALASAVMSFPLLVLGARQGFEAVPRRLERVAESLGASRRRVFFAITLPHAARGILHGLVCAFARGLGEFGATSLVAGHIPGRTETLALAIQARIENFDDRAALALALVSVALALATIGAAEHLLRARRR